MRPSTSYKLIVYAENGVSLQSGAISAQDLDVVTDVAGQSPLLLFIDVNVINVSKQF